MRPWRTWCSRPRTCSAGTSTRPRTCRAILGLLLQLDHHGPRTIIELFDRLPRALLPVLAGEFAGEFLPPLRAYAGAIRSRVAGFPFAYADTVARRMRSVFVHTRSPELKTLALEITLIAAVELNRFAAMNVFNGLLTTVKDAEVALAVVEMLRSHARYYQKVAEQVPPGRLHGGDSRGAGGVAGGEG